MYSVSQDYLDALDLPVRTYKLAGTIGGVSFDESNVLSIEISNQVSEGSEIKLGSVYIGELTASFYGVTGIARGSWVGKTIVLSEGLMLADKAGFITGENICIDGGQTKLMIYHGDHGWTLTP